MVDSALRKLRSMSRIARQAFSKWKESWSSDPSLVAMLAILIISGAVVRSLGFWGGTLSLWLDEALWANRLENQIISSIRPVGYMACVKGLISIYNSEVTLRLLSYLPSLLALPLVFLLARRVFASQATALIGVFVVAFHPTLVTFAKEFKPYSLEHFLHLLTIYLVLVYIGTRKRAVLGAVLGLCVTLSLFATNIVFLLPSVVLVLLFDAYMGGHKKRLLLIILASVASIGVLLLLYVTLWTNSPAHNPSFWGRKYDVFHLPGGQSQLEWVLRKFVALVEVGTHGETFFPKLDLVASATEWIAKLLFFFGIGASILKRDFRFLVLFVVPVGVCLSFNLMGWWPWGAFRANIFLFGYVVFIFLYGIDALLTVQLEPLRLGAVAIVAAFVLLRLPWDPGYFAEKRKWTYNSRMREVIDTIYEQDRVFFAEHPVNTPSDRRRIVIDAHGFHPLSYYMKNSDSYSKQRRDFIRNNYRIYVPGYRTVGADVAPALADPSWVVIAERAARQRIREYLTANTEVLALKHDLDMPMIALVRPRARQ